MTDARAPSPLQALLHDWITVWQSEWAALATDREQHEAMQRGIDAWAAQAHAAASLVVGELGVEALGVGPLGAGTPDPPGHPGADAPPRPAPAAAAPPGGPGAPDAERHAGLRRLEERVAELERRLPPA